MSEFMLCATMGLNGFVAMGVRQDWATHMIGHELTALHGFDSWSNIGYRPTGIMAYIETEKNG